VSAPNVSKKATLGAKPDKGSGALAVDQPAQRLVVRDGWSPCHIDGG